MKALLYSGGIDSASLAFGLRPERLLFVDYGQRPVEGERRAARAIAGELNLHLDELALDLAPLGSGTMAWGAPVSGRPPEHWPYRNQMLLTVAAMRYSALPLDAIMIGTVLGDEEHSDGTPVFLKTIDLLMFVQSGLHVEAPAATRSSEMLVADYDVPTRILEMSFSCHEDDAGCGRCRGCAKRARVMKALSAR